MERLIEIMEKRTRTKEEEIRLFKTICIKIWKALDNFVIVFEAFLKKITLISGVDVFSFTIIKTACFWVKLKKISLCELHILVIQREVLIIAFNLIIPL